MSELRTQGDPIAVEYDVVLKALALLGIHDPEALISVIIGPMNIRVERFRLDQDGHRVAAGDEFATTTNIIAFRRDES